MKTGQNGTLDLDFVWHSGKARIALVPPMSVKDRSLHWILVRSQTYYPEHILIYGSREGLLLACCGFRLFFGLTDWRQGWWRSKHRTESGTQERGLGVQVWTGPGPRDRRVVGWSSLCLGYKRACVLGYLAGHIDSRIVGDPVRLVYSLAT